MALRSANYPAVMTAVYRLYDATGRLLYVGVGEDFDARLRQHSHNKPWWPEVAHKDVTWFADRLSALSEEARAIEAERPLHNARRGQSRIGLMVTQRTPSHLEGYDPLRLGFRLRLYPSRLTVCPLRPKLEFNDTTCRALMREAAGRADNEIAIIREGEPAAMVIPWHAFVRYSAALGEAVDPGRMNEVALGDLCRKERAPRSLSVRLEETLVGMGV